MLLGDALSNQPLEVLEGNKVIEVRLRGVSKASSCGISWITQRQARRLPPSETIEPTTTSSGRCHRDI